MERFPPKAWEIKGLYILSLLYALASLREGLGRDEVPMSGAVSSRLDGRRDGRTAELAGVIKVVDLAETD